MKKKCIALTLVALLAIFSLNPHIYAWLFNSLETQPDLTSHVHKSYFQSGDGTAADQFIDGTHATEEGCAFEIKYPIQLYYFAWLQALGYFNAPNEAETGIQQYYFYLSEDLDMTGWVLPPIGTQEYPFVGNFDGNGHTVSNLTVQNVDTTGGTSLTDVPDDNLTGLNIVGFFGVVGEIGSTGSVNGYTYSSAINEVKNFTLDNITIKTDTDNSLIGAIAGYVNGTVAQAAVSDANIVVDPGTAVLGNGITNISDYSLVGYCTDAYKFTLNVSKVTAHAPEETQNVIYKTIQGEGAGFGGSIKMQQLFNRLTTIRSSIGGPATSSTYVTAETVIYDEVTDETSQPFDISTSSVPFRQRVYDSLAGSYSFSRYSSSAEGSGSNTSIVYLYGRDDATYVKNLTTITRTNRYETGFVFSSSGQYLNINGSLNGVTGGTDSDAATGWVFDNSGHLYTYGSDGRVYYLNGDTALSVSTSANTVWTQSGGRLSYSYNGAVYYLDYSGGWTVKAYYVIRNNGHYLNVTSVGGGTATLSDTSSVADLNDSGGNTLWSFSVTGANPSGTVSTTVNGTTYYLTDTSGTLSATTAGSGSTWSNNGTSLYCGADYLEFDSDWHLKAIGRTINSGTRYLNITASNGTEATLGTGTSVADNSVSGRTVWLFDDNGYVYAAHNGTTYYLRNDNGALRATTTSPTAWTDNGTSLSSGNYYLSYQTYVSKWALLPYPAYTINRGGTYLNLTGTSATSFGSGTSVADWTDASGHTIWMFSNTGTHPSGTISTMYNGTRYYLYSNSNTLNISSSNSTSWTNSNNANNRLSVSSGGWNSTTYYIYYRNNVWGMGTSTSNSRANMTITAISQPTVTITASGSPPSVSVAAAANANFNNIVSASKQVRVVTRSTATVPSEYPEDTYIPLNCVGGTWNAENTSINASSDNTGYIVSGSDYHNNDYFPDRSGDIRVSEYNMSYITNAVNGNGTGSNFTYNATYDSRLEVITAVNYDSYSGYYRVSDSFNRNNNNINTNISSAVANSRKVSYVDLGLKRYQDARTALSETFLNSNKIYGLHFMNAEINKNDCAVVPQAMINGDAISNLTVPRNSIDFFVKRRGFITVFAGTYFTDNNAFFSLHEITRNDNREITNIKEISKIYRAVVGRDFIYEYTDGSFSSNAARGSLAFDMAWMTNPSNFVNNAVYYFEIPVNGGEYALGSVTNKQGAYLFYLDIAANAALAEDKDRITVTEMFREENYSVALPRGVQLVNSGDSYDVTSPYEFATVELQSGYGGTYTLSRENNDFYYTPGANNVLTYIGGELNAKTRTGQNVSDYIYYPSGFVLRRLEHSVDSGRDTGNNDHMLVETIDSYDTSGVRTGRTVKVYADIDNSGETDESALDLIVTFTYNPSGHDNMKTRIVRASSEGGFSVSFDENVTLLSVTIASEEVHVNFGDQYASILVTATYTSPLPANTVILAVDMSGNAEQEDEYHAPVYGIELATYVNYYEGAGAAVTRSTSYTMANLDYGNAAQSRTLTYAITLSAEGGATNISVYGKKLIQSSYSYTTKVFESDDSNDIVTSGTITVTLNSVTINGTALGSDITEITVT